MASDPKLHIKAKLTEVEAAIRLRMSPELLEYFTRVQAKAGIARKLACETKHGLRWYEEAEGADSPAATTARPAPARGAWSGNWPTGTTGRSTTW